MGHPRGSSEPKTISFQGQSSALPISLQKQNQERTKGGALKEKGHSEDGGLVRGCFLHGLSSRKSPLVVDTMHEDHHLMRKLVSAM